MRKNKNFYQSLKCALVGFAVAARAQRNIRFHIVAALFVVWAGVVCNIGRYDAMFLLIGIAFVVITEFINTAIEDAVDVATTEYHSKAKDSKDIAAGAVLFASVIAVCIGAFVFLPEGRIMIIVDTIFASWGSVLSFFACTLPCGLFVFYKKN